MEKVISNIIQILKDVQASASPSDPISAIKFFYFGDPILIPASALPAIVVMPVASNVKARGVGTDQEDLSIRIKVVQNQKDFLGHAEEEKSLMTVNGIRLFEERDTTSFEKIKETSIIGALRRNPELLPTGETLGAVQWNGGYSLAFDFVNMWDWIAYEISCTIQLTRISDRL